MKKLQPNTYFRFIGDPIFKVVELLDKDQMRIKAIRTGNERTVTYPTTSEDEYTVVSAEEAMLARLAGGR